MHRHFFHERNCHRSRHGWGGRMGHDRGERRGGGRRFGRFFEHGDLRWVVLALLEERTGGAYRPSPGVV